MQLKRHLGSQDQPSIYRWKQLLRLYGGKVEVLNNGSRAPHTKRASSINTVIVEFIRETRKKWPHLGKQKIKPLLDKYCEEQGIKSVSVSTIGRVIKRYNLYFYNRGRKKLNRSKDWAKKQRRGDYLPNKPGDLVQIDTIVLPAYSVDSSNYRM